MTPLLVTTAIPYVNSKPHLGFAFEALLADCIARHQRRLGRDVRFASGTDENSLKNALAAEQAQIPLDRFIDDHARAFADLAPLLDLSYDAFVRTSVDANHRAIVERLWSLASHDLYRSRYRGRYCGGCEAFLESQSCPEHEAPLEEIDEENWFFRLTRYREPLRQAIESGALQVVPAAYARESLQWLDSLRDVSVSRTAARARGVGIPVPGDVSQVIYVWFDALAVYLTALDQPREAVHVVGKGIVRFHSLLWPAILLSTGLPLPKTILVHGYLTVDGQKISKSGVSVDPRVIVERHGVDEVRHYLLGHVRTARDGDVREDRIAAARQADLANGLGNLVQRVVALVDRHCGARVPPCGEILTIDEGLIEEASALAARVDDALDRFAVDEASGAIFGLVASANRYVDRTEPWALAKRSDPRLETVLHLLLETVRIIADALAPFLPTTSSTILARLSAPPPSALTRRFGILAAGTPVHVGEPLFPRR